MLKVPAEQASLYSTFAPLLAGYLTEEEAALELRCTTRVLQYWRLKKSGPPHVKIGRKVYYSRGACARWLTEQNHSA